mgnify:FL=1
MIMTIEGPRYVGYVVTGACSGVIIKLLATKLRVESHMWGSVKSAIKLRNRKKTFTFNTR